MCPSVSRECRALSFAGAHTEEQRAINFGEAARNRPAHSLARCGHAPWLGCEPHVRLNTKVSVSRAGEHTEQRSCEKKTTAGVCHRRRAPPKGVQSQMKQCGSYWMDILVSLFVSYFPRDIFTLENCIQRRLNKSTICWIYNVSSFFITWVSIHRFIFCGV